MAELLNRVIDYYLDSGDFNGLYIHRESDALITEAVGLAQEGFIQVVDDTDYMNVHIRPWQSKRSVESQIRSLTQLATSDYGVCLYPTPKAMSDIDLRGRFDDEPYSLEMARGKGTLELAYFKFEVLEPYRNDPRFSFRFGDYGADISVSDEVYLDEAEPEDDKISISHVGFAYNLSAYSREDPSSTITRRVCAFYGDLKNLNKVHQQRWRTYRVEDAELGPHPIWFKSQMGHWPDGLGPFARLFFELKTWNELHKRVYGEDLLKVTDRPDDFGWILRPSQQEYDRFVQELDKLLSDNIRHAALDTLGAARTDAQGNTIGTLNRLDDFLRQHHFPEDARKRELKPLREVRSARQRPAHSISSNVTDTTFIHRQVVLIEKVAESIEVFRRFWQRHPSNSDWQEPEYASLDSPRYRL